MQIYCNSKGESSALVSNLTLSPPEVPDLAFTPVSHLLLKAIGTSSHLPHYGVNVYTDRHSNRGSKTIAKVNIHHIKPTHATVQLRGAWIQSHNSVMIGGGTHTLATVCASTWSAQANTCRKESCNMQMKRLFLYLLFLTLSVAPLISVVSRPFLLSFAVHGLCKGLSPLQSPSYRFNRSCESLRLNPPPLLSPKPQV